MYGDNLNVVGGYPTQAMEAKTIGPVTMKQRLDAAVRQAEDQLASAKRARELLDKNPDIEELLNILQRGRF